MANYTSEFTGQHNDNYDERITALESQNLQNQINALQTTINTLQTTLNSIQDYIISTNTSGIWTIRTWKSGKKEAFGRYTTNWTPTNAWNTGKYIAVTINFPSNFFTTAPFVVGWGVKTDGSGMPFVSAGSVTSGSVYVYIFEPAPSSSTNPYPLIIEIYAFQL